MKTIILESGVDKNSCDSYRIQQSTLLFQINYDFYLIIYPSELEGFNHLETKEDFFKKVIQGVKKQKTANFSFQRRTELKDIKKDIRDGLLFKSPIKEICYLYGDNAGKGYAFNVKHSILNYFQSVMNYGKNYDLSKKQINESDVLGRLEKECLLENLNELFHSNFTTLPYSSDTEFMRLSVLMTKQLRKQIKSKSGK